MTAPLKRYRAVIRDTRFFEVIIAAHDVDEAWELAGRYALEADLDALCADDGDVGVEFVDDCDASDDQPPAIIASPEPEVAS